MIYLNLIVEDQLSEVVARKMLEEAGRNYQVKTPLLWNKDKIRGKISDINDSARGFVYFVLTDQDTADRCPPQAINELSNPMHQNLLYRFAVMEVESWVMAHRKAISKFLSVSLNKIPTNTDSIPHPKEYLVGIAKKSKSSRIRKDIAPRDNSTSKVGPDYNGRLTDFVINHWNIRTASQCSPSLRRAFERLNTFTPANIPQHPS